ncbi:MAG: hypothetical protein GY811_16525 [Myxococcales bacterium]|nr:hypothetical protein [Myxococcales bacterium]
MLRAAIERFAGLAIAVALVGLPLQIAIAERSPWWLALASILALWIARLVQRLLTSSATSTLAKGECSKAKRRYLVLRITAISRAHRLASELSLAACDAAAEDFERCLERLSRCEVLESEESLFAVALNLRAYCMARRRENLEEALTLADECVLRRPYVDGFRHTRGLLLLELGRNEEALRDLEATWGEGQGTPLFESERCFDLGRLWSSRGQDDYARDYFARALRAFPEGPWAQKASELVGPVDRATIDSLDALL